MEAWGRSTANPANRTIDNFSQFMNKKNSKEMNPFLLSLERDNLQSAEAIRGSFLSPRTNIDRFKNFPIGMNQTLHGVKMRRRGNNS